MTNIVVYTIELTRSPCFARYGGFAYAELNGDSGAPVFELDTSKRAPDKRKDSQTTPDNPRTPNGVVEGSLVGVSG